MFFETKINAVFKQLDKNALVQHSGFADAHSANVVSSLRESIPDDVMFVIWDTFSLILYGLLVLQNLYQ